MSFYGYKRFLNRYLGLCAMALLISVAVLSGCGGLELTPEAFLQQYNAENNEDSLITLCRTYLDATIDEHNGFNLARLVAHKWDEIDPNGLQAYLQNLHAEDPVVVRYIYLLAENTDDPMKRLNYLREVIRLSPVWPLGYIAICQSYIAELFSLPEWERKDHPYNDELQKDIGKFFSLSKFDPDNPDAYEYEYRYLLFSGKADEAGRVLAHSTTLGAQWIRPLDWANVYAQQRKDDLMRREIIKEVARRISEGQVTEANRTAEEYRLTLDVLVNAQRGEDAVTRIKQEKNWKKDPDILYQLAHTQAATGKNTEALSSLEKAVDLGWNHIEVITDELVFADLHKHGKWKKLVAQIQHKWDRGQSYRKKHVLSERISKSVRPWSFCTSTGDTLTSQETFGKVVVLDFWSERCEACTETVMPVINDIAKEFDGNEQVQVYSVRIWDKGVKVHMAMFKEKNYAMTPLFANAQQTADFGVEQLPYTCVIDKSGTIRFELHGLHEGMKEKLTWMIQSLQ